MESLTLRNLCSPFSSWRSRSTRTPQDHAKTSGSSAWDYEKCMTEMKKKPQIGHILDIMKLDMLLLNLIELNTGRLKTETNQNHLKHLVELIKMNVHLLIIHEPDLVQPISKLNLEELDRLLGTSHTTDQASAQQDQDPLLKNIKDLYEKLEKAKVNAGQVGFDQNLIEDCQKLIFQAEYKLHPVKKIKEIYDLLEYAKATANAAQVEFGQNLIKDIRRLIQQCHEVVQAEPERAPSGSSIDSNRQNNDVPEHIVNLLPVELRPASSKSNLRLVKENLELIMNQNLFLLKQKYCEFNISQIRLTDMLSEATRELINQIRSVDCRVSNLQAGGNWEETMKSHAAGIIQLMCNPKTELYIDRMNSFKDICNQVAAMYKHSHHQSESERRTDDTYTWCRSFHKDIFNGNCKAVEKFLDENPLALTAIITVDGNTVLHVAIEARNLEMVKILSEKLREVNRLVETLKKQNEERKRPLYIAASSGDPIIAKELMLRSNKDILLIECEVGTNYMLPLFVAAKYGNKDMVEYIYDEMQKYEEKESSGEEQKVGNKDMVKYIYDEMQKYEEKESSGEEQKVERYPRVWVKQWALFFADLIYNDDYDMALRVVKKNPSLGLFKYTDVETPLFALAQRTALGANVIDQSKASIFQFIPFTVWGNKKDDDTASKASQLLEQIILNIDDLKSQKSALSAALFKAAEVGNVEFVAMFIKSLPMVVSWLNDQYQNIFHVAIINRKEKVFNLIYGLGSVKNDLTGSADKSNNWMLHLAGEMAPAYLLHQVPGPAMQLQRELQWFEAVEKMVPNSSIYVKKLVVNKTPHELFTSTHKDLMKDGEGWMKDTASSCSIVAALITTVMFAAAFTVPGGNNQDTGFPMFLGDISFLVFAISDLIALSTSCTSVLIFLSILTSRFAQADFLKSLPKRLLKGLVLLFVSMAAMMVAFCDTIYIIFQNQYHWFCIPIIVLVGLIPVGVFLWMMFPLLMNLWRATYTPIFENKP